MDTPTVGHVATIARKVSAYGTQLASVLHHHALAADDIPRHLEGAVNIIDATVSTLSQATKLLDEHSKNGPENILFNDEALKYVLLLANECAATLAKIEPTLSFARLGPKERREKRKADKKELAKNGETKIGPLDLSVDEKAFLNTVENTHWGRANLPLKECVNRLYELQLHLLLVYQVVQVGALSKDLSSGKVDIKEIVACHERICKTADLVGIKPPAGRSKNSCVLDDSSSESGSGSSASDSDSDVEYRKKRTIRGSPPPLRAQSFAVSGPGGPLKYPASMWPTAASSSDAATVAPPTMVITNPPSYAESHNATNTGASPASDETSASVIASTAALTSDSKSSTKSEFPTEEEAKEVSKEMIKTPVLEPRLFKTNTNSFGFKLKSIFRSKQSLAEEMKKALNESESQLLAFIIRGYELQKVPHSAFHSLEATHMRTILSQLNDNSWYKTFVTMSADETAALNDAMSANPLARPSGEAEKEVVVLKVVDQKRWAAVKDLLRKNAGSRRDLESKRVLLAIVREKLVAGQSMVTPLGIRRPQPTISIKPKHPILRQPPGLPIPTRSNHRISDLRYPEPPSAPPGWHVSYPPGTAFVRNPVQRPPSNTLVTIKKPELPVISDPTIYTGAPDDFAADRALRIYTEYTLRQVDYLALSPNHPVPPKSWERVSITQESNPRSHLMDRIASFKASGGNVIEVKLRLSEHQSTQISRLLDEIKSMERDGRFDWSWVEISLYTHSGIIANSDLMRTDQDVPFNFAPTATHMHLIAERALRPQYVPLEIYNQFMKGLGKPFVVSPPVVPLGPPGPPPIPVTPQRIIHVHPSGKQRKKKNYSSSGSGSGSESSGYSSDSSIGVVRRKMRSNRAREVRARGVRDRRRRRCGNECDRKRGRCGSECDSGSDSDSGDEEDVIEIKVVLRRGDDVVGKLLELWTPGNEGKGKGKEKEMV